MFEDKISSEVQNLISEFDPTGSVSFNIASEKLRHDLFYSGFIKAESEYSNFKLLLELSAMNYFDDKLFINKSAFADSQNFVDLYSSLDFDYLDSLVNRCVEMKFNYTIRPFTSLTTFVFSDSYTISANEFVLKMAYFNSESLITHVFRQTADEICKNDVVSLPKFIRTFKKVLKSKIDLDGNTFIVNLADEIFELMINNDELNLSVISLMLFFDDLEMYQIVDKLGSYQDRSNSFNFEIFNDIIAGIDLVELKNSQTIIESGSDDSISEVDDIDENGTFEMNYLIQQKNQNEPDNYPDNDSEIDIETDLANINFNIKPSILNESEPIIQKDITQDDIFCHNFDDLQDSLDELKSKIEKQPKIDANIIAESRSQNTDHKSRLESILGSIERL